MQPCREGLKVMLFNSYYVFLKSICLLLFRNLMAGNWFHTTVKVEILAFWHSYMKLKAILHVSSIFVDLHNFSNFGVTKFGMPYIVIIPVPDTRNRVLEQKITLSSNLQKKMLWRWSYGICCVHCRTVVSSSHCRTECIDACTTHVSQRDALTLRSKLLFVH